MTKMKPEDVAAREAQKLLNCVGCVKARKANLHLEPPPPLTGCECYSAGLVFLAAVIPAIQAQERERIAEMIENSLYIMSGSEPAHLVHDPKRAKNDNHHATIAAAIRARNTP